MAPRLKWSLAVGCACVAITALIALGRIPDNWSRPDSRPDNARLTEIASQLAPERVRYREAVYAEATLPLLPDRLGMRVVIPSFFDAALADTVRAATSRQLADIGSARARAGVFVVRSVDIPGAATTWAAVYAYDNFYNGYLSLSYFAGTDEAGPYCAVVGSSYDKDLGGFSTLTGRVRRPGQGKPVFEHIEPEPLGPCFYWTRYGAPGRQLAQWLRDGGYSFAERRTTAPFDNRVVSMDKRGIFGIRKGRELPLFTHACVAGDREACARTLLAPGGRTLPPNSLRVYERKNCCYAFAEVERALLADLEREFGTDRFARFWTSAEPLEAAFANAFGTSLGEWVHGWALRYYPAAEPVRAAVAPWTALMSLLTIGVLCGAAMLEAHRRQIR
jgi:hypothetical protein